MMGVYLCAGTLAIVHGYRLTGFFSPLAFRGSLMAAPRSLCRRLSCRFLLSLVLSGTATGFLSVAGLICLRVIILVLVLSSFGVVVESNADAAAMVTVVLSNNRLAM